MCASRGSGSELAWDHRSKKTKVELKSKRTKRTGKGHTGKVLAASWVSFLQRWTDWDFENGQEKQKRAF